MKELIKNSTRDLFHFLTYDGWHVLLKQWIRPCRFHYGPIFLSRFLSCSCFLSCFLLNPRRPKQQEVLAPVRKCGFKAFDCLWLLFEKLLQRTPPCLCYHVFRYYTWRKNTVCKLSRRTVNGRFLILLCAEFHLIKLVILGSRNFQFLSITLQLFGGILEFIINPRLLILKIWICNIYKWMWHAVV